MNMSELPLPELCALTVAVVAIFMLGSRHLRVTLLMYAVQTSIISVSIMVFGIQRHDEHLYLLAILFFLFKGLGVPVFLSHVIRKVGVGTDPGTGITAPISMHLSVVLFGASFILARQLPVHPNTGSGCMAATAAISLVCSGMLVMLTRRIALNQIIGFLIMENGIFLFGLTQTIGMPMLVEMGILLDVLVGVMVTGLIAFRIQKSFEHIDTTRLAELKD
jgi:hydrogenase-4 component E